MKRNSGLYLIALILGILFSYYFPFSVFLKILTFPILIILFSFLLFKNFNSKYIKFLMCFFIGFFVLFMNERESTLTNFYYTNNTFSGDIYSINKTSNDNFRYELKLISVDGKFSKEKVFLYSNNQFDIGDRVEFSGKLKPILKNSNSRLFNFKKYASKKFIFSMIYSDNIKKIGYSNNFFIKINRDFNNYVNNVFGKTLSENNSNFMKKVILNQSMDIEFEENIRDIGISHIIAISGLHIGILYLFLDRILLFFPIKRFYREILNLLIICFYGGLIGNPASVLRAEIFLMVTLCTIYFEKINDSINSLYLSAVIILIVNPYMIFDIGLYLSFLSVFAILKYFPILKRKRDNVILSSLKITFSVVVFTLPIIFYFFGEFSLISFIANIILIPFFMIAIILGFVMLIFGVLYFKITIFIGIFCDFLLNVLRNNVEVLKLFNLKFKFYDFNFILLILYYIILFLYFKRRDFRYLYQKQRKDILIFIVFIIFSSGVLNYYENRISINFIDIGQGDACLIRGSSNNILIDTGGTVFGKGNNGKTVILPYLRKMGVKKLDYVIISHLDADHCKNLKYISENIKVKNVLFRKSGSVDYENKYGKIQADKVIDLKNNAKLNLSDMDLDIIQTFGMFKENNKSLIANLNVNSKKILFTGDIDAFTENQILKKKIDCDFLKIPHHGSKYSSSEEFLKTTSPKISIISCGYKNKYGHPHNDAIMRISKFSDRTYRTDLDGNIILDIDRHTWRITGYNNINENLIGFVFFYMKEILTFAVFILLIIIFSAIRRNYELHSSVEFIKNWRT